jgi:hypothetical protein
VTLFSRDLRAARPELRFFRNGSNPRSIQGIRASNNWRRTWDQEQEKRSF